MNRSSCTQIRSSYRRCSIKKGVPRNFTKFIGKQLCQSLFFNKVAGPATLLKKRLWHTCFPVNFAKLWRTTFFTEHLWWLLLKLLSKEMSNICSNFLLQLKNQRSGSKTLSSFSVTFVLKKIITFSSQRVHAFYWIKTSCLIKKRRDRKWKISHTVLQWSTMCFSSCKNYESKIKLMS